MMAPRLRSTYGVVSVLEPTIRQHTSSPEALRVAATAYFNYQRVRGNQLRNRLLYFVDFGLRTLPGRGWVLDMERAIAGNKFPVAHGSNSGPRGAAPVRFGNESGSNLTSLGLYLIQTYRDFHGHASGAAYESVAVNLRGESGTWNDQAGARTIVAHGAPYVTSGGRSNGCPAVPLNQAEDLLRPLEGGVAFLFALESTWRGTEPWIHRWWDPPPAGSLHWQEQ
jgi:hypothetical protein